MTNNRKIDKQVKQLLDSEDLRTILKTSSFSYAEDFILSVKMFYDETGFITPKQEKGIKNILKAKNKGGN